MRNKFLAWLWVALCTLSIFCIVPVARAIQKFASENWGRAFFGYFVLAATAGAFLVALYILIVHLKIRAASRYIWLIACAALYFLETLRLWENPEEAVHFLEYGLLGFLLFRAWRLSIPDKGIYLASFFTGSLVGTFDEILQWILPDRYWDIRDLMLNALAVGLFQVALGKGIRPKLESSRITPKSARIVSLIAGLNLLLLGACLSNTSGRLTALIERFPFLRPLEKQEPMREFIMKHTDPDIGVFYSRLTAVWLQKTDRQYGEEYGKILNEWKDRDYDAFLKLYKTTDYPFLHEMRVHIFRRDKKYEASLNARDARARKNALFIAFKENLILEKYFGETLKSSVYRWTKERKAEVEIPIDKNEAYTSPVSKNVFYWLQEGPMWTMIVIILVFLSGGNILFAIGRKNRQNI
jgi:VanZ family protein